MARLAEISLKTTTVWEAPERVLKIFQEGVTIRRHNFGIKRYGFAQFYKDCLAVCPELLDGVKLISVEKNTQKGVEGLEFNMVILEEWATEEQTKQLLSNCDEKIWPN